MHCHRNPQRQRAQTLLGQASKRLDNAEKAVSKKPQQSRSEAERKRESERRRDRDNR